MVCRQHYNVSTGKCLACAAPSAEDGGCLVALVGLAVLIGTAILIYVLIPKPPPPPWQVTLSSDTAQHSGRFDNNDPNNVHGAWSELQAGASLTFTGITPPKAGTYTLDLNGGGTEASGWTLTDGSPSKEDYTLSVLVNGDLQTTFHLVEDGGSTHPIDVPLREGENTIQVKLDGRDDTYYGNHTYVIFGQITLTQKTT